MKKFSYLVLAIFVLSAVNSTANDYPKASSWVNDYAGVLTSGEKQELDSILQDFEASDSTQVFVAIMDRIPGGMSVEEYGNELFARWQIGQKKNDNGVLFAVFIKDRKMRIEVGYGLESHLTDAESKLILSNEVTPAFKQGKYYLGIKQGINGIIQAARGAYKGTGRPRAKRSRRSSTSFNELLPFIFFVIIVLIVLSGLGRRRTRNRRSWSSRSRRPSRQRRKRPVIIWGGGSRSSTSSRRSGGGSIFGGRRESSGRGFGGFSGGGGGSSGGGGASGSW